MFSDAYARVTISINISDYICLPILMVYYTIFFSFASKSLKGYTLRGSLESNSDTRSSFAYLWVLSNANP